MKALKPYYKRGNKLFFRKGKKKMTVAKIGVGNYVFDGDVIEGEIFLPMDKILATLPMVKITKYDE